MPPAKITIVGAGNVGATTAHLAALKNLGDIVLLDIVEGLAQGKALDLGQTGALESYDCKITGTKDWAQTAGSDLVIVTSGLPRKPGMSRDNLLTKNVQIVKNVSTQIVKYSPDTIVIVVCNPLDAMVHAAARVTGFAKNKVIGMAGELDAARFSYFVAEHLGVGVKDVKATLLGGHGDDMVPLPGYTSAAGIPITQLLDESTIARLIDNTRNGGIEVVNLLGSSAYYAPAAGVIKMARAILRDTKTVASCCAYCHSQYNTGGYFVGVPVVLGKNGVEKVIELRLNRHEQAQFAESLAHVKQLAAQVDKLLE